MGVGKVIWVPVVIALLLTVLLQPLVDLLVSRARMWRGAAAAVAVLALVGVVGGLLALAGQQIATGFADLWSQAAAGLDELVTYLSEGPARPGRDPDPALPRPRSPTSSRPTPARWSPGRCPSPTTVGHVLAGAPHHAVLPDLLPQGRPADLDVAAAPAAGPVARARARGRPARADHPQRVHPHADPGRGDRRGRHQPRSALPGPAAGGAAGRAGVPGELRAVRRCDRHRGDRRAGGPGGPGPGQRADHARGGARGPADRGSRAPAAAAGPRGGGAPGRGPALGGRRVARGRAWSAPCWPCRSWRRSTPSCSTCTATTSSRTWAATPTGCVEGSRRSTRTGAWTRPAASDADGADEPEEAR